MGERFGRDIEKGLDRPTQVLLRQLHLFDAQRRTVRFKRVLLVRGTETQVGADENQRRPPRFAPRGAQCLVDRLHVVAVFHRLRVPAIRLEALRVVLVTGNVRTGGERHMVIVEEINQLAEFQLPGERSCFGRHALHQVSVADQPVGKMIDDLKPRPVVTRRKMRFGNRHAHAVAESLAERASGGFYARSQAAFRVTWRNAAPLAELLDLIQGQIIAGDV